MGKELAFCLYGDRAVFLDSIADRYFCLPPVLNDAFIQAFVEGNATSEECRERLARLGISPDSVSGKAGHAIPQADAQLAPLHRSANTLRAGITQWMMQSRLRRWGLAGVLSHERARQPSARKSDGVRDLARLHAAFIQASLWLGESNECLSRSLAFRKLAFHQGHRPWLVIGVKLDPFAAHCWVQTGGRIDNDTLERTRIYAPILFL